MASSPVTADNRFDVAAFIDARAIGGREIAMLVISSVILFIDGFDMYFLGKIAPAVARGLGGQPADMTAVFTWQQIGLAAGAFLMPPVADRFGRRPTLAFCLCGFGLLSLVSAFVANLGQLTVLRGISGLFLANVIDRNWRTYLDRKVVHFVYFYALWVTIQFAFKAPGIAADVGAAKTVLLYLESFIEPFGTLWFIYLLPIFFVAAKLARNAKIPVAVMWGLAAALEILPIETGWTVIDEFASRFVYFYTGYILAPHIFAVARGVQERPLKGLLVLIAWGVANGYMVFAGCSELPFVSLALGLLGAAAVIRLAALLSAASNVPAMASST